MTIDESVVQLKILKEEYDKLYDDDYFTVDMFLIDDDAKAIEMAIASLEAWERVKDDIHEYETDCMVSADCQDCKDCNVAMFKSIYHIIDKHLQEVTE
jgi:hypothetical protein